MIYIKTVMLIAGGRWQVPIAKKIKEMGHKLICSNLYPDSPAFKYADKTYVANVLDKESNLKFAKENNIDAVVSDQSDISMETVAYIADNLGLASNGPQMARLFHSKIEMRKFCKEKGFPSPDFRECRTVEDALDFYKGKKTIVIKPANSQAARGFFRIDSPEDIIKNFDESLRNGTREKIVIAEDFIDGREFTIDGIFINGVHHNLSTSIKTHYPFANNIANEIYFTHKDTRYDIDALIAHDNALMNATGAHMGLTHNEYKFTNGEFVLVEMSNRGGGNNISGVVDPLMSGVDSMKLYVRQALGEEVNELTRGPRKNNVMIKFFDVREFGHGDSFTIHAIEGLDEVSKLPGVVEIYINYKIGDVMHDASNGANRPGYYIAYGDSREELDALHEKIMQTIRIY